MSAGGKDTDPLDEIVGYHLRRAWNVVRKDFEQSVESLGVRQVTFAILSTIGAHPGVRQGDVGKQLDIQRANMVTLVGELVDSGLVERGEDPSDRRAITLRLTTKGEGLLGDAREKIATHEQSVLGCLSTSERRSLIDMLKTIIAAGND